MEPRFDQLIAVPPAANEMREHMVKLDCGIDRFAKWRGVPAQNELSQHHRIVMHFVVGGIHERDRTLARQDAQLSELIAMLAHFVRIAAAKLLPARGIVSAPACSPPAGTPAASAVWHVESLLQEVSESPDTASTDAEAN
jgi:hypothetical protein